MEVEHVGVAHGLDEALDHAPVERAHEVGMGLVPPYPLGRAYRDLLGRVNARVAARSDRAYLLVAGLPLDLKRLAAE